MARLVQLDETGPERLDVSEIDEERLSICQCGLSENFPFCDGSHHGTRDESEDTLYRYEDDDDENPRHVVEEVVYE